jgi:hypothetical protein
LEVRLFVVVLRVQLLDGGADFLEHVELLIILIFENHLIEFHFNCLLLIIQTGGQLLKALRVNFLFYTLFQERLQHTTLLLLKV